MAGMKCEPWWNIGSSDEMTVVPLVETVSS
ncbi:Uncharacterised protein [Mycobacterium tuberculosis]|nr:Uncharacterised protein [Mycobacterium tuberculosis]